VIFKQLTNSVVETFLNLIFQEQATYISMLIRQVLPQVYPAMGISSLQEKQKVLKSVLLAAETTVLKI